MKKIFARKNVKWLAVVSVAFALTAALLTPFAYSFYIERSSVQASLNTGLGNPSAARTDVDNMFIYMMNRSLPVGSIYVTEISDVTVIEAKFGGTWEPWGEGRAPVGEGGSLAGPKGGTMPTAKTAAVPLDLSVTGSVTLDGGTAISYSDNLTLSGTGVTLSGYKDFSSIPIPWLAKYMPSHTHPATMTATYKSQNPGTSSSPNTVATVGNGTGSLQHPSGWSLTLGNRGSTSLPDFSVNTRLSANATADGGNQVSASVSVWPTINYTVDPVHVPQKVTSAAIAALGAADVNSTLSYTDDTIQPYVTVYMYRRTALEPLA